MSACVFSLSNCIIVFANIDHITFDTARRVFKIALRDEGGSPVGGMETFAGFFLLGVGNMKRSEFYHFYCF